MIFLYSVCLCVRDESLMIFFYDLCVCECGCWGFEFDEFVVHSVGAEVKSKELVVYSVCVCVHVCVRDESLMILCLRDESLMKLNWVFLYWAKTLELS